MWNTKERGSIVDLHFDAKICSVRMNHRRVVVLQQQQIHIFDLKAMKVLHVMERMPSQSADPSLSWLCAASERGYLATPMVLGAGGTPAASGGLVTVFDTHTLTQVCTVLAHRSPIQALCINPTGQLLATASMQGTVVRLFGLPAGETLFAFRRGTSPCRILGLLFTRDSGHICASASSGTVHLFRNSERVLGALPLQAQEATVGAAQREMVSQVSRAEPSREADTTQGPQQPQPWATEQRDGGAHPRGPAQVEPPPENDDADLDEEWTLVSERPERLLELSVTAPARAHGAGGRSRAPTALQSTAKYANKLLDSLPQPCREFVDAPHAFAWIHLRQEEKVIHTTTPPSGGGPADLPSLLLPKFLSKDGLRSAVLGGSQDCRNTFGGYVACALAQRGVAGLPELLVATTQGCARMYDWSPTVGGECRLRKEYAFVTHEGA